MRASTSSLSLALAIFAGCGSQQGEATTEAAASGLSSPAPQNVATAPSGIPRPQNPSPTAQLPDPIISMKTSLGEIVLRLDQKRAPRTVSNFVDYAITRHYDGTIFHQIDAGYVVLGGTFTEKLVSKPTRYAIPNESDNGLKNKRGTIAMARNPADPNSATSQFFINLVDNPHLDRTGDGPDQAGFCVFGEVVRGLDVLEKLSQVRTATVKGFDKMPVQTVVLESVGVFR